MFMGSFSLLNFNIFSLMYEVSNAISRAAFMLFVFIDPSLLISIMGVEALFWSTFMVRFPKSIFSEDCSSSNWAVAQISILKRSSSLNFLKKLLVFHKIRLTIAKEAISKMMFVALFLGVKFIQILSCTKDKAICSKKGIANLSLVLNVAKLVTFRV